jgi:hypothetical protein
MITTLIPLAIILLLIIGSWRLFEKAGQPGWGIFIPIYNVYLVLKIAGRPGWWLLLYLIPLVNIVVGFIVAIDVARNFGKSALFGFFLIGLFGFIGIPIIAFGNATYEPVD